MKRTGAARHIPKAVLVSSLIAMAFLLAIPTARSQVPPNAVEIAAGYDFTGLTNVTSGAGANLAVGCLCEVVNASSGEVIGSFSIGDGTEGPPGTFKPGQFYYLLTVGPNPYESRTVTIFVRAYDGPDKATATAHGESQTFSVTGGNTYNIQGWSLPATDGGGGGGGTDQPPSGNPDTNDGEDEPFPFGVALVVGCAVGLAVVLILHQYGRRKGSPDGKAKARRRRRR